MEVLHCTDMCLCVHMYRSSCHYASPLCTKCSYLLSEHLWNMFNWCSSHNSFTTAPVHTCMCMHIHTYTHLYMQMHKYTRYIAIGRCPCICPYMCAHAPMCTQAHRKGIFPPAYIRLILCTVLTCYECLRFWHQVIVFHRLSLENSLLSQFAGMI